MDRYIAHSNIVSKLNPLTQIFVIMVANVR